MTDDAEAHLDQRMADLDSRTQLSSDKLDRLSPQLDRIGLGLSGLEDMISGDLALALQVNSASMPLLSEHANNLPSGQQIQSMRARIAPSTCKQLSRS